MSKDFDENYGNNKVSKSMVECQLEDMRHKELLKEIHELKNEIGVLKKQSEPDEKFWTINKTIVTSSVLVASAIVASVYYLKNG